MDKSLVGTRDGQTVFAGGGRSAPPNIAGVQIIELGNVITRSGTMTEIFRSDWPGIGIVPKQINWVELRPGGVTDWHRHAMQTDHLVAVNGVIKLALWDGRAGSATYLANDVIRMGLARPVMVIVPTGVWHALRNESGVPAGYINAVESLYDYGNPDNWRLDKNTPGIPDIL